MTTMLAEPEEETKRRATDASAMFRRLQKDALEQSLYEYVKAVWHLVEPSQEFCDNWHVRALCHQLEQVYYKRTKRLIINIPPGTMKSLLVEVFFPTWVWAKDARKRFLCVSYGAHLTTRDNLRARQIIESQWYQAYWPVKLLDDQNTKTRYNTNEQGWRIATSVNGVGTGEHPDYIIVDDPTAASEAESEVERAAANNWFDNTASTRLGRNPAIIVVMQRLHMDDLSGHLIKRGGWTVLRWPMRFEVCTCPPGADENAHCLLHKANPDWTADPTDERTSDGELLFPSLFPEEKVRQLELDLGPYGAAGQLQQRPSPAGGGLFQAEWFQYVDKAPEFMRMARGWDTAASEGKGDYTVGVKIGEAFEWLIVNGTKKFVSTGRFYVLDVKRGQWGPSNVDKMMVLTAQLDGKDCAQREEKEGGSAGKTVIEARTKLLKGYNYAGVQLGGSKVTRAKPFRSQCEGGNVFLLRASWNAEYVRELCNFPTGTNDDQVDGSSCAFNSVLLEEPPKKASATWGSGKPI